MGKKTDDQSLREPPKEKAFLFRFIPGFVYSVMPKLKLIEHRVLWILADHADNLDGTCYVGIDRLSRISKMDHREVLLALKGLIAWGVIENIAKGGGRKAGSLCGLATLRRLLIGPGVKPTRDELTGGDFPSVKRRIQGGKKRWIQGGNRASLLGGNRSDTGGNFPIPTPHSELLIGRFHSNSGSGMESSSSAPRGSGVKLKTRSKSMKKKGPRPSLSEADLLGEEAALPPTSPIEQALIDATDLQRNGEPTQKWLKKLVKATCNLPEEDWDRLLDDAQEWTIDAVAAIKQKKEILDPASYAAGKAGQKPSRKSRRDEDDADEETIVGELARLGVNAGTHLLRKQGKKWYEMFVVQMKKQNAEPSLARWCVKQCMEDHPEQVKFDRDILNQFDCGDEADTEGGRDYDLYDSYEDPDWRLRESTPRLKLRTKRTKRKSL